MPLFTEIAIVIVVAVLAGFIAHLLRQPPIIGFIAAGALIGFFEYFENAHVDLLESFSSIGVALLLFLIGIQMNFSELKRVTSPALFVGIGQILITFGLGFFIVSALGFSTIPSFYIALALTFSSTIVVVKLLSEKENLYSLYGRIVLGILLIQDLVAILALIFIAGIHGEGGSIVAGFVGALLRGAILIAFTLAAYKLLPKVLDIIGRSQEMLYLFSIAWALGISSLAAAVGLSVEIGGFLAGLSLASSSEHFEIGARLRPLRDFFVIIFFVGLGIRIFESGIAITFFPAIVLTLFVLIGTPIIVMVIMGMLGYRARTSFLASSSIAQVSEFSLILVALGYRLGDLTSKEVSLVTIVCVVTIFVSSYFIVYQERLYEFLRPVAKRFEFRKSLIEEDPEAVELSNHIVLIGVDRMGEQILRALSNSSMDFVAIDFNPVVVKSLRSINIPIIYGDVSDVEIQKKVGMYRARIIISTIPDFKQNLAVLNITKMHNKKTKLILTAETDWQAKELYKEGADYVLVPHFIGGRELAELISKDVNLSGLHELKKRDLKTISSYI
jgi:Kef-type K+ transport system membrane component KefB/voltage-gated potassium channel Kch